MNSAAFQEKIQNGMIRLPVEAQSKFDGTVNVLVWQDDAGVGPAERSKRRMLKLIRNPVRVAGFKPLSREECNERPL